MFLNLKLSFSDTESLDPNKKFVTTLKVELILDHHEVDLHFNLGKLYVGKDIKLDEEDTQQLLDMFGELKHSNKTSLLLVSSYQALRLMRWDTKILK